MVKVKVPASLLRNMGRDARNSARSNLRGRNWSPSTVNSIEERVSDGRIALTSPIRHVFYQEYGTKPFLMKSLEGKRVPIGDRVVTAKDVGKPGFVHIPRPGGGPDIVKWRDQKWRHPGIKPNNVLHDSLNQAYGRHIGQVRTEVTRRLYNAVYGPR